MKRVNDFNELTHNEQCLLVGMVAKRFDLDTKVTKIAEDLGQPVEVIYHVCHLILEARENQIKANS